MSTLIHNNIGEMITPFDNEAAAFYQNHLALLVDAQAFLASEMERMRRDSSAQMGRNPLDHWNVRLKPASSVKDKCRCLGYPPTVETAITNLHDIVAARAVCAFIDDIYVIKEWFYKQSSFMVMEEKDYIKRPKPNGYRSCHLIARIAPRDTAMLVEIQLRTLAMDCWAALEHQMKYKNKNSAQELITLELKRCSDELASTEWNLLAIREMLECPTVSEDVLHREEVLV